MPDVLEMRRTYYEHEKPLRQELCSAKPVSIQPMAKQFMLLAVAVMLTCTVLYISWSLHHMREIERTVNAIHEQRASETAQAERMADAYVDAVIKHGRAAK